MPLLGREDELFPQDGLDLPERDFPWQVAYTRSRQEKSLARQLLAQGVPYYLPQYEKKVRRTGRVLVSFLPLFPGYVFFRGNAAEKGVALRTNLLVRTLEVRDQSLLGAELASLRALQVSGGLVLPLVELGPGDPVRITEGPFRGQTGIVLAGGSRVRLIVSITLLRQSVAVEFDRSALASAKMTVPFCGDSRSAVA
jgi:transcription antitermination factor NusG